MAQRKGVYRRRKSSYKATKAGVTKAKGKAYTKGKKVSRATLKKPVQNKSALTSLPRTFRVRGVDIRDRTYRIANYMGFMPGPTAFNSINNADPNGFTNGDLYMRCGWPLHLAHNPNGNTNQSTRMRTYGEALPLEIGLELSANTIDPTLNRVGDHKTVYAMDMEKPPGNVHYSSEIPVPRFQDVGLGQTQSMCQLKMKRCTTTIEFGCQPFSLSNTVVDGEYVQDELPDPNVALAIGWKTFLDPVVTRNWHDEVRIVQLAIHSDGELCDFLWEDRNLALTSASKKWVASRFFDFDDYPHRTLYNEAGARLDFYAPVTGKYRQLSGDGTGCTEAFWQVDVLYDQIHQVSSSPLYGGQTQYTMSGLAGDGMVVAPDSDNTANGVNTYAAKRTDPVGADSGHDPMDRAAGSTYFRPVVPTGKSNIVVIDYPMDHALWYTEKTTGVETVKTGEKSADLSVADLSVLHCENLQILTFIFSKNGVSRPIATCGAGVFDNGVPGFEAPGAIAAHAAGWSVGDGAINGEALRGDGGTVAAFFCGKVVKEFAIPDKV